MLQQPTLLSKAVRNRYLIRQYTQLRIFLVYGLFIDDVGSSSYMASNDRTSKCEGTMHFLFTEVSVHHKSIIRVYEGWNINSGNYLFTTNTK